MSLLPMVIYLNVDAKYIANVLNYFFNTLQTCRLFVRYLGMEKCVILYIKILSSGFKKIVMMVS